MRRNRVNVPLIAATIKLTNAVLMRISQREVPGAVFCPVHRYGFSVLQDPYGGYVSGQGVNNFEVGHPQYSASNRREIDSIPPKEFVGLQNSSNVMSSVVVTDKYSRLPTQIDITPHDTVSVFTRATRPCYRNVAVCLSHAGIVSKRLNYLKTLSTI